MKRVFPLIIILLFTIDGSAQHKIEGTLPGFDDQKIILLEYFGDKHRVVDSTRTDENGWFSFDAGENPEAGLYSLALDQTPLFNFIFNHEDIIMKFEPGRNKFPEFVFSIENLIYYDYLMHASTFLEKAGFMTDVLQYYPEKDSFYLSAENSFYKLQESFRQYSDRILREYPHTFVSHIVKSDRPPMIPGDVDWTRMPAYRKAHDLDEIDFSDTLLINTDVFTGKAIEYLGLYSGNQMNKETQEKNFIQAVDTLLYKAMENGKVFDFLMQYLIEGFDRYGFDKVISHIAETYEPSETCVDEARKSELQTRIENLRRLAVGKTAPDIEIRQKNGTSFRLEDAGKKNIVVLFWASWCPHCEELIPQIISLFKDPGVPEFEVVAVSVDTSKSEYAASLAKLSPPWISHCDFLGWDTQAAVDYSIYATPTMFLIDSDRNILARPVNAIELKKELNRQKSKQ